MTPFARRIVSTLGAMASEQMQPRAIYLTEQDRKAVEPDLTADGDSRWFSDIPVRQLAGSGSSRIYSTRGVARSIRRSS